MRDAPRLTIGGIIRIGHQAEAYEIFVADPRDHIAGELLKGGFYETEELEIIARHVKTGARIVEVGANIGNHTVYFERIMKCSRNTVFEVNPTAIRALEINIRLNELQGVDTRWLGIALSDRDGVGEIHVPQRNLGGTSFVPGDTGSFTCRRGDSLLAGEEVDFIKIDVEGGELQVLEGLSGLIDRCDPMIFIEIDKPNDDAFHAWVKANRYDVVDRYRRYVGFNYMIRRG